MADQNLLAILKQGVDAWNNWVSENDGTEINLGKADLRGINLSGANLSGANLGAANLQGVDLSGAFLTDADLTRTDLSSANLSGVDLFDVTLFDANLNGANLSETNLSEAKLKRLDLSGANLFCAKLSEANLKEAKLTGANLSKANLSKAVLYEADLSGADLREADLFRADFQNANLQKANLFGADLTEANLIGANLQYANLSEARLTSSDCYLTDFRYANLSKALLDRSSLVDTRLEQSILTHCRIYGLSAWNLSGVPKDQSTLIITPEGEPVITVDDLQVAQFIYLLLNNENVRNVIDTVTSKAVLILGRFTPERKAILDQLRQELGAFNYVPILFDFENTRNQSLLETVMTLAGMSRFVVADVTAATMVREELRSIVEKYPAKPIQPILLQGDDEYVSLPELFSGFKTILPTFFYKDSLDVTSSLAVHIIAPAEQWLDARKQQLANGGKTLREIDLEKQVAALQKQLREKKA